MENELLAIGKVAALSGLPVSALRFYDGVGILSPWWVDPSSGYRFYRPDQVGQARLLTHLRRVGLPLDDIRTVVADVARARPVLAAHLDRLEAGLADARREISTVYDLLENTEIPMHCTLPALALLSALREVRYAVGSDPEQPRLHGIHLDSEPGVLRLAATDRFRLATSSVATDGDVGLHLLLPTAAVDEMLTLDVADASASLEVRVAGGRVTISGAGCDVQAEVPDVDFPSYRSLLEHGRRRVPVDAAALRDSLSRQDGGVVSLSVGDRAVSVAVAAEPNGLLVTVNREYLLEALGAGDQLTLAIDDPIAPLAIRAADRDGSMSVLMPVRLDEPA